MLSEHWKNVVSIQRRRDRKEALITSAWAIPVAIGIVLIRPLKFVRICAIRNDRIGHFVPDGAEQVVRYQRREPDESRVYYFAVPVSCNQQWETMIRRTLPVKSRSLRHVVRWLQRLPGGSNHVIPSTYTQSRDIEGLFKNGDAGLSFTPEEEATTLEWLKSKGWAEGQPFICLLVRDTAFTVSDPVANHGFKADPSAWDYHSYRNSDIETYVPAIKWLNDQGVWVLRMGRTMERRTPYSHDRFVDYAFDSGKSDLLDIWLFANADAIISTGTGPDMLAGPYRVPILMLNVLPVTSVWSWCNCTSVPKVLLNARTGKILSLAEHLNTDLSTVDDYRAAQIDWRDLTADEMRDAVRDFWAPDPSAREASRAASQAFWSLAKFSPAARHHGYLHPDAEIDHSWLSSVDVPNEGSTGVSLTTPDSLG